MKERVFEPENLSFSHEDQMRFAEFSGDKNPIHTDQEIAKKTISGERIVHGLHLVLRALEYYTKLTRRLSSTYRVQFKNPVPVGQPIRLVNDEAKNELRFVSASSATYCIIKIENKAGNWEKIKNAPLPELNVLSEPNVVSLTNFEIGTVFPSVYGGAPELGPLLFPNLCQMIGATAVYEIAILSNIVGMQVPGLHSLFSMCSINLRSGDEVKEPYFELAAYDERLKFAKLAYRGTTIDAEMDAFERPYYVPKSCSDIKQLIPKEESLSGLRTLIIGGSRGIGESVARVAALLGSDVSITYNSSKSDALLISEDIKENCRCTIDTFEFDVTSQQSIEELTFDHDILCYFASGKIFGKVGNHFDIQKFERFYQIYCVAFNSIARKFLESGGKKIYYPSSIVVEFPLKGLEEYAFAKKLGEEVCKTLAAEFDAEIIVERLDRVNTDQTLSVIPITARDSSEVAIDICKRLSPGYEDA